MTVPDETYQVYEVDGVTTLLTEIRETVAGKAPLTGAALVNPTVNGQTPVTANQAGTTFALPSSVNQVSVGLSNEIVRAEAAESSLATQIADVAASIPTGGSSGSAGPLLDVPGLFIPGPDANGHAWGYNLLSALQAGQPGVLAVHGDSVTQGCYASSLRTKSWPGLLATALQAKWGDGGTGFHGVVNSDVAMTAVGFTTGSIAHYGSVGDLWSLTGTWSTGLSRTGPGAGAISAAAAGATATATGGGRFIDVAINSTGFSYTVDSGSTQTITGLTSGVVTWQTIDCATTGNHTLTITTTDTSSTVLFGAVFRNQGAAMARVDKYAVYAATSNLYGTAGSSVAAGLSGGATAPTPVKAQMLIHSLINNDIHTATASDAFMANVVTDLDAFQTSIYGGTSQGAVDVLFALPHVGKWDSTTTPSRAIKGELIALCRAEGYACIDTTALGHNSWDWMNTQGYWGTSSGSGATGTDFTHLSDTGHAFYAAGVSRVLAAVGLL